MIKQFLISVLFLGGACLTLVSCGDDGYSPYGGTEHPTRVKVGKPYQIKGVTYKPKYEPHYSEIGMASWYGPGFDGRMTASGEKFDQEEMTAAHRTLPMPSMVRVTRLDTGKSIIVRINDRGPFAHGRIIDLSKAAARELDMLGAGVAKVKVEHLPDATIAYLEEQNISRPDWMRHGSSSRIRASQNVNVLPSPANQAGRLARSEKIFSTDIAAAKHREMPSVKLSFSEPVERQKATYRVQAASLSDGMRANQLADDLASIASPHVDEVILDSGRYYRVSLGPVYHVDAARQILNEVKGRGHRDARILVD